MSTESQLAKAQKRLASLSKKVETLDARDANRHWTELDSATRSGIRRKPDHKADARRFDRYAAESQLRLDHEAAKREVERLERRLAHYRSELDRVRFTLEDFAGAEFVRDRFGWHKVARVNKTTVSVETGYSWVDRIVFANVLEIRRSEVD